MQTTPPDMPSGLTIFAIGIVILSIFLALLWAVNELPKKVRALMSRSGGGGGELLPGVEPVRHPAPNQVQPSAEPNTSGTSPVPGAAGAGALDAAARDIIRAALIAELLDSGLLTNRDKAICQAFNCSKAASTRPDSRFQIALRLVEQHRKKLSGPEFRELNDQHRPAALDQPA